jgi:hypothetical protein
MARNPCREILQPATSISVSLVLTLLKQLFRMYLGANLLLLLLLLTVHLVQLS